jgi:quinoprotein glucose dehydrogenase
MRTAFAPFAALCLSAVARAQHGPAAPDFDGAAADLRRFQPAAGLKVEVWAAEPQLENPVAFAFDNSGRCFIAETHRYGISIFDITQNTNWLANDLSFRSPADRGAFLEATFTTNRALLTRDSELVRLVEDRAGIGRADTSTVLADGFRTVTDGTAAGVAVLGTNVWFGNIPALWRLSSDPAANAPGSPARRMLAEGFGVHIGVTGHDLHGLVVGPDGRLYMSFGDRGACITNREGRLINLPDTGGVLRCEPDGRNLEVFCQGLRNPQDLEFDDVGNLWTVDNDTAGEDPCRVLHLVQGADYGWRCSYQHMEGFGPWVQEKLWKGGLDGILPPAGTVSQGPAGLAWYPGTGFGERLRDTFIHCDFPGGVISFWVTPDGASYSVAGRRRFLWNLWPTDVKFGPDGAAYVLDWVSGWQMPRKGRIYRVTDPAEIDQPAVVDTREHLRRDPKTLAPDDLTAWLSHPDRRVRLAAQFEAAARGTTMVDRLRRVALAPGARAPRLHALWGLGQIERATRNAVGERGFGEIAMALSRDPDVEVAGAAAALAAEHASPGAVDAAALLAEQPSARARFLGLEALDRVIETAPSTLGRRATRTPVALAAILGDAGDPYLVEAGRRHAGAVLMRADVQGGAFKPLWEAIAVDARPVVRRLAVLALRRTGDVRLGRYLRDADPRVAEEAARAVYDSPAAAAYPALAELLDRRDNPSALLTRLVRAAERVGGPANAMRLARVASATGLPMAARREALLALADWRSPRPVDAIVGLWRPFEGDGAPQSRDLGRSSGFNAGVDVRRATAPAIAALRAATSVFADTELAPLAARAAVALDAREFSAEIAAALPKAADAPAAELLDALAELHAPEAARAVRAAALQSAGPLVKEVALRRLAGIDPASATSAARALTDRYLDAGRPEDLPGAQAGLVALPPDSAEAGAVLDAWWGRFEAGRWPESLALDLEAAAARRADGRWPGRVAALRERRAAEGPVAASRWALAGGSAVKGRRVFLENRTVQCSRCHKLGAEGGTVGPSLDHVASRGGPEYILESILLPNAKIAQGYETAVFALRDGRSLSGVVRSESGGKIVVEVIGEDGSAAAVELAATDVLKRERGPGAMPEGLAAQLTPFELRDLVAFLGGLR